MLQTAMQELNGICIAVGALVTVYAVDAEVAEESSIINAKQFVKKLKGGGGTDMRVGIKAADKKKPDLIVVITDGDTPWPESKPRAQLLVLLTSNGRSPSFAKTLKVEVIS
jgi:predicted metal-dependent peptidase